MKNAIDNLNSRGLRIDGSAIRGLANRAMGRDNLIPLWFGEPDQSTPQFICDAAAASLKNGETFYSEGLGIPALRETIANYQSGLYNKQIKADRIAATLSGSNALNLTFQSILDDGDKVVTALPTFPNLLAIPSLQNADVSAIQMNPTDDGWSLDAELLLEKAKDAKVVILNSPGNPTGWTMTQDEQKFILSELRKQGTWLVADEVYSRIYYEGRAAPSFLQHADPEDRVISINSFSKSWAMTGWRMGWITAPESLLLTIQKLMEYSVACVPVFTQRAGIAAINEGENFIATSLERYRRGLNVVAERFAEFENIHFPRPKAAFYAYFQIIGSKEGGMDLANRVVDETGVGIAPGVAFDPDATDWFRICFAQSEDRLHETFDRMTPLLREL